MDVIDCAYDAPTQIAAIDRLVREKPDAVISIPFGGRAVSRAFRAVSAEGIKLILLDNAPSGLLPEADYVSVVSSDNFGLGQIAASLLSPHVPSGGSVGIVAYKIDFFATAQREIAFSKWMQRERPDIALTQMKFETPAQSGLVVGPYLDCHPDLDGLFVVWDEPAVESLREISRRPRRPAMTTVDLGKAAADALIRGDIVKGVAAQRPFEQGHAAAIAAVAALTGQPVPPWIVLPGLSVTASNVVDAYRTVGGEPASPALMGRRRQLNSRAKVRCRDQHETSAMAGLGAVRSSRSSAEPGRKENVGSARWRWTEETFGNSFTKGPTSGRRSGQNRPTACFSGGNASAS